jgi:hypothetical protein
MKTAEGIHNCSDIATPQYSSTTRRYSETSHALELSVQTPVISKRRFQDLDKIVRQQTSKQLR